MHRLRMVPLFLRTKVGQGGDDQEQTPPPEVEEFIWGRVNGLELSSLAAAPLLLQRI